MAWHHQYDRVVRWLERIENIPRGTDNRAVEHDYEDFLWAFFQNCWHLKDWVQKDPAVEPPQKAKVKEFVDRRKWTQGDALKVCAELANGTKHFELDKPRVYGKPESANFIYFDKDTGQYECFPGFVVAYKGKKEDALVLAGKAKAEWDEIILAVGLVRRETWEEKKRDFGKSKSGEEQNPSTP